MSRHFGDVYEAFDAIANLHETTKRNQLGYAAIHKLSNLVSISKFLPWVLLGCFEREADALAVKINFEYFHGHFVTDCNYRAWVINMLPRQFGNVDQTVHASKINERTEGNNAGDSAATHFANLQVGEELVACSTLILFEQGTTREHNVVSVAVELEDLCSNSLANVWSQIANTSQFDERGWQESA